MTPEQKREYDRAWRAKNRDKTRAANKRYEEAHAAEIAARKAEYYQRVKKARMQEKRKTNGDAIRAYARQHYAKHRERYYEKIRVYVVARRGLTKHLSELDRFVLEEALDLRIKREKESGFNWHIDHITPIALGGSSEHFNIQVVPAAWNIRKGGRRTQRFFGAQHG